MVGAVTSRDKSVQGCDSRAIGSLRYFATASPDFMARWFPGGRLTKAALMQAPCLTFNQKDQLQNLLAGVDDPRLREALQKMGQGVFSESSGRKG